MVKFKKMFAKGYAPNWSEEVFLISRVKNTVPRAYVNNDLNGEKMLEHFTKKSRKK